MGKRKGEESSEDHLETGKSTHYRPLFIATQACRMMKQLLECPYQLA